MMEPSINDPQARGHRVPEQPAGYTPGHDDPYYDMGWTGGQVTGPEHQAFDPYGAQGYDPYGAPGTDPYAPGHAAAYPVPPTGLAAPAPGTYPAPYPAPHQEQPYAQHTAQARVPETQEPAPWPPDTDRPGADAEAADAEAAADDEPGYHIPPTPDAGWDMAHSRRRGWVSRAVLLCVLAIQAVLSLRLGNTAFQDEALYLRAGHSELDHLLHGTELPTDYDAFFSGSAVLHPVLAALVDSAFGLAGARALSLALMLGTTALLYSFTRRMFNERVALGAAALFAVTQSTIVLGNFATYDAAALFLLALAAWIVVRTDRRPVAVVLLAAPVAALAVGVKYASGLYLPTLVVLAVLTAWPHHGRRSLWRGALLAVAAAGIVGAGLLTTDVLSGIETTTTGREHGTESALALLRRSLAWGGLLFATACLGAFSYARRGRMNESPRSLSLSGPGPRWRFLVGVLLCGTAVLAPAYQMYLGTGVSLFKHVGFGLLFAAPMAGIGVSRLVGAHFRYPQLGILLWVVMLCAGLAQSTWRFGVWPDSTQLIRTIEPEVNAKGRYLSATSEVPAYYLREKTSARQWFGTYSFDYKDARGAVHTGRDGYKRALDDGWFDLVVLDGVATGATGETEAFIAERLKGSAHYRLLATIPFEHSGGTGIYRVWAKR
ncbi:glycosyltransferase family 39 protein [Streptomyces sp. NPDC001678]|uniref:ArnT family glycosyltransferase n=1 Tax=Streptomyces sp. NPDC001678 TaxID=3364599 RepID=UPI0036A2D28D